MGSRPWTTSRLSAPDVITGRRLEENSPGRGVLVSPLTLFTIFIFNF